MGAQLSVSSSQGVPAPASPQTPQQWVFVHRSGGGRRYPWHESQGPEQAELRTHLLSDPLPISVKDTPEGFMKEWKEIAEAMNMKFTIRAMRPSWWGLGIPQQTGCKNVLTIREIVPNDPVIDVKALDFSLDLVHDLEQKGALEFASVDVLETGDTANPARADPDAADDADEELITMYGVTMTLKNKKVGAIRAQRRFSWIVDEDTSLTQVDMFHRRTVNKREERDAKRTKRIRLVSACPDPAAVSACPDPATASSEESASVTVALKPRQASVVTLTPGPAQAEAKPAPAAEGSVDMGLTGPDAPAADEGSRRDPSSTAEKATPSYQ